MVEAAVILAIVILAAVDRDHADEFNRNVMLPVAWAPVPGKEVSVGPHQSDQPVRRRRSNTHPGARVKAAPSHPDGARRIHPPARPPAH